MFGKLEQISCLILIIFITICLICDSGHANSPTVKLAVQPNIPTIVIGSKNQVKKIAITARAIGTGLKFNWTLQGPGKLAGNISGSAVVYIPPNKLSGSQDDIAIVSVSVENYKGTQATDSFIFNIISPTLSFTAEERGKTRTIQPPHKIGGAGEGTAVLYLDRMDKRKKHKIISSQPTGDDIQHDQNFYLKYSREAPDFSVEWSPTKRVEWIKFSFKNHNNGQKPEIEIIYVLDEDKKEGETEE